MSGQRGWEMQSTHSLEAGAEWLRKQANATAVFVVRGEDCAFAVAPGVRAADARLAIEEVLPAAAEHAAARQQAEREAAVRKRAAQIVHDVNQLGKG